MKLHDVSETFRKDLEDPEFVEAYLSEALSCGIPTFLIALRDVVKAGKGMGEVAVEADLSRESLYRTLSEEGRPHLDTITRVLRTLGLRFDISHVSSKNT